MCGEHHITSIMVQRNWGSSPHVRGARGCAAHVRTLTGIIPACAGSTFYGHVRQHRRRDHPRMCGEHGEVFNSQRIDRGSSPHVRGARSPEPSTWTRQGIIPACAGSTQWSHCIHGLLGDHPRMCGEHSGGSAVGNSIGGSSPHVRGALRNERENIGKNGIIPACAGSTSTGIRFRSCSGDHPRMCGEHCYS